MYFCDVWTKNLSEYSRICQDSPNNIPVFWQPWWLDAACSRGSWIPLVHVTSQTIWPVFFARKWGIRYVTMPPLTPRLGWWQTNMDFPSSVSKPPFWVPYHVLHLGEHHTPCQWLAAQGFEIRARGFYLLDGPFDVAALKGSISKMAQRQIGKAQQHLHIKEEMDALRLHQMMNRSMARHGMRQTIPLATLDIVVRAALQQQQGRVLTAFDQQGNAHATAFFLWDNHTVYYLGGGLDERLPQLGASRWLLWQGLQIAAQVGKSFEFGGGNDKGVGEVYASMGGQQRGCYSAVQYFWK